MSDLRRYKTDCNLYFITNVIYKRLPILVKNGDLLMTAIDSIRKRANIVILAFVILPDHFHCVIDVKKIDISKTLQKIKMSRIVRSARLLTYQANKSTNHPGECPVTSIAKVGTIIDPTSAE